MSRPNKPTKDKIRRGHLYLKSNPETVRSPQFVGQAALPDRASAATHQLNQSLASLEVQQPLGSNTEAVQTGRMCLQALVHSPHFAGRMPQTQIQSA
ncbi:MAG: hypothetical protein ACR2FM_05450 [Candidatus Saccharimonadales bacterium]